MRPEDSATRRRASGGTRRKGHSFKLKWTALPPEPPKSGGAMTSGASRRRATDSSR